MLLMFQPIERCARLYLAYGSLAAAICAVLVVPLAGSTASNSSGQSLNGLKQVMAERDDPWKSAMVKVTRDPFLLQTASPKPPTSTPSSGNLNSGGMHVIQAAVRGIAFGDQPKAIVEIDGATKIVAAGDFINRMRIESILSDRIVMDDGSVLMFSRRLH